MRYALFGESEILVPNHKYILRADLSVIDPPTLRHGTNIIYGNWTPEYFLYLYNMVGRDWCWFEKNQMPRDDLTNYVRSCEYKTTLLHDGQPAGMGMFTNEATGPELLYFGLFPDATGRGLGKWYLQSILYAASDMWPNQSMQVETCILDSVAALPCYKSVGFVLENEYDFEQYIPTSVLALGKRIPAEIKL